MQMKLLQERIVKDGQIEAGNILKVDSFLNHQIDVSLLEEIGKEFHRQFAGQTVNKILTIEASGIAEPSPVLRPAIFRFPSSLRKRRAL